MGKTQFLRSFFAKCSCLFAIIFIIGLFFVVHKTSANAIEVSTAEELQSYLSSGGEIKLVNNITLNTNTYVTSDATLDLNGYTLDLSDKVLLPYETTLTIEDYSNTKSGTITGTAAFIISVGDSDHSGSLVLNSGTIDCKGNYGIINYGDFTINDGTITGKNNTVYNQSNSLVMNGGTVISELTAINNDAEGASFVMNGGLIKTLGDEVAIRLSKPDTSFIMNDGIVEATYNKDNSGGNAIVAFKYTEVTINGGTLTSYSNVLSGNGSRSGKNEGTNAKFTINGGTLTSLAAAAIYAPQIGGITTITGGNLTGKTGVEIRSGVLNISGGTITGNGEYVVLPSTNGNTTFGAAVAIAQHTTAQSITVNITGGNLNAEVPISDANPLGYDQATLAQATISITGGNYTGDDLDDVIDNIPEGYAKIDESSSTIKIIQTNPAGYYLTASSSGSVSIAGPKDTVATDYSEISVISNCRDGYNFIMSSTVNSDTLYLDSDNTSSYSFSPIEENTSLDSTPNTWGYLLPDNASYIPTASDHFYPVPTLSTPIILKSPDTTARDNDINDKMHLYYGANIGNNLAPGIYQLPYDESDTPGSIVYQITANPTCTNMPVEISFNQNIDGEGGDETDPSVENFPTYMDNSIRTESGSPTTIRLSDKTPTRDDYLFVKWNTRPDGTGTSYQPNDIITVGSDTAAGELIGSVTLYAIWTDGCAGGTICYDGNGADAGTMDDQVGDRNTSVLLTSPNFSRTNYGFAGWNTKVDGTGTNYGPQQNFPVPNSGGTILYANWVESTGTLQTWTGADSMEIGDIIALTDERDNQTYAVAKLDDGQVWFIENLRLDPSAVSFTLLNTNNPTNAFATNAPASSSSNSFCKYNSSDCIDAISYNTNNLDRSLTQSPTNNDTSSAWYSYGVLYNWYTATAGNGTYAMESGTVSGDICPSGWRLPTGDNGDFVNLDSAISGTEFNDIKFRTFPNNFIRSGEFNGDAPSERGGIGRYWSSTASEQNKAYRFGYGDGSLTPNNTWNKWSNFTVRCIYDGNRIPASKVTVNLPEHATSISLKNATYGDWEVTTTGTVVTLANNSTYTISATFEDGYTINTWTTTEGGQLNSPSLVDASYIITTPTTLSLSVKESDLTTYTLNYNTGASAGTIPSSSTGSYNAYHVFKITDSKPFILGQGFIGWSETEGSTTVDYTSSNTITLTNPNPDTISVVTKTLYAVYQADSCPADNICYFGNNADDGSMPNQSASSNSSTNLIPSNYSRSGYGFAGWTTSENTTTYGPNATITTPDLSSSGLKLYAKWVSSNGTLQGWTGCSAMNTGGVTALTDTRDNNTYAVAKLADNKCWIIENLRLDPGKATITTANTNNPTSSFVSESRSATSTNSVCKSDSSSCMDKIQYNSNSADRSLIQSYDASDNASAWYSYGTYYNWYTATAGNGTYSSTSGDTSGDICPAGWHLPTGNTTGEYKTLNNIINNGATNSDANWRAYPNNFIWSGDYNKDKRTNSYINSRIWTSTAKDNNNAYRVGLESSSVTANDSAYKKWDAFVVRCVNN